MPTPIAATSATVQTTSGAVRGVVIDGVHTFRAVPFAAPPVGPFRFAAPQPPERWDGVRDASAFGPTCPQPTEGSGLFPQTIIAGDDCLHLNVHTPSPGVSRLPVLVWIHGGGMALGCNADAWTQGERLAARGLVVVAINYRLGTDGFLSLRDVVPNRGVLDWNAALAWVQDNIAAFGGDPGNVTIGGQSAGSVACLTLLADPRASGLFRRVVAMSGIPCNLSAQAEADLRADELATLLGVDRTADGLDSVPYDRLFKAQLELAPVAGIVPSDPALKVFADMARWNLWLGPVPDGEVVPLDPLRAIQGGAGAAKELLVGSTVDEMDSLMEILAGGIDRATAVQALAGVGLDAHAIDRWFEARGDCPPAGVLGAALTAINVTRPVHAAAEARFAAPAATFVYEVAWQPPTPLRAVHAFDLPYMFDTTDADGVALMAGGEPPPSLTKDMSSALVSFVTDGDPGWPRHDEADRATMSFDLPSKVRHDPGRIVREVFGG